MRTLHNSGLLGGSERSSLHVRRLTGRQIVELYDVHAALEGQAVLSILTSDNAASAVDELEAGFPRATPDMTYAERFELDLGFHEALCRLSGNETLLRMWTSIKDLMQSSVGPPDVEHPHGQGSPPADHRRHAHRRRGQGPRGARGSHGDRSRRPEPESRDGLKAEALCAGSRCRAPLALTTGRAGPHPVSRGADRDHRGSGFELSRHTVVLL